MQNIDENKSPLKAISDYGPLPTAGSSGNYLNNQADLISSQSTQVVKAASTRIVAHKTPQIKPSVPGLSMPGNSIIPDTYSNDDGGNK